MKILNFHCFWCEKLKKSLKSTNIERSVQRRDDLVEWIDDQNRDQPYRMLIEEKTETITQNEFINKQFFFSTGQS